MSTREDWLNQAVDELRPVFDASGYPLPDNIRVSCGNPSRNARSANRAVGEWHSAKSSSDNTHEIFVSPVVADPFEVFGILVHELAHSATEGDGHRGRFPKCVRKLHLEGKPTHTKIGARFKHEFGALIESLGEYPHAPLNLGIDRKVQGTRNLRATCPQCGFLIHLTRKWAYVTKPNGVEVPNLPICPNDNSSFILS